MAADQQVGAPTVTVHGAARTVTGSCYEIRCGGHAVLVDCGLFQGPRSLEALNFEPFAFVPARIDAVVLTHAHIDHSGLLPRLVANGYEGNIWCTAATGDLLAPMLADAGRIQEWAAERRNRRPDRRDQRPVDPIYTEADAVTAAMRGRAVALESWFEPAPGFRARLWNAGHILGSASVEVEVGGVRLLFSGDIGPEWKSLHPDPSAPAGFDHVFCESTYGDRGRATVTAEERRALLAAEVRDALDRGGNLVIPVFAVERTQELMLDLAVLLGRGALDRASVFVDSPLASRVTGVFRHHAAELEDVDGTGAFDRADFHFTDAAIESMRLNDMSGAVIMAASGMCEAGRIRHHLLHNLPREDSTILFVGFQAAGTLGRTILDGAGWVRLSGRDVAVRARVRRIDSYSAHADQGELLRWIEARRPIAGGLFLTHGEEGAIHALAELAKTAAPAVVAPRIGETWSLPKGRKPALAGEGRADLGGVLSRDWQNDYADFAANLKGRLVAIGDDGRRREAIAAMGRVLADWRSRHPNTRGPRRDRVGPGGGGALRA
ncbi:MBL fold metallo-hydrolase [Sphingomonas sp. NPDC079357]|uniref:MBL fold metallo-hydrolase n=1 Tax=Sphingomonas sp. NPDC079357 TaxID=3364518 RepID=UPI00384E6067